MTPPRWFLGAVFFVVANAFTLQRPAILPALPLVKRERTVLAATESDSESKARLDREAAELNAEIESMRKAIEQLRGGSPEDGSARSSPSVGSSLASIPSTTLSSPFSAKDSGKYLALMESSVTLTLLKLFKDFAGFVGNSVGEEREAKARDTASFFR